MKTKKDEIKELQEMLHKFEVDFNFIKLKIMKIINNEN